MYIERKFRKWQNGLLHLFISICVPIIPVVVYMLSERKSNSYLYVLLITTLVSLVYEFLSTETSNCSIWIKWENIVCSALLLIANTIACFLLFLSFSKTQPLSEELKTLDIILAFSFLAPIVSTLIEIIRSFAYEIEKSRFQPDEQNLVDGAGNV